MTEAAAHQARQALTALAGMSSTSEAHASRGSIPHEWFRWLPAASVSALQYPMSSSVPLISDPLAQLVDQFVPAQAGIRGIPIDRHFGDRLAAVDQLRPWQRSVRIGWLFLAGEVTAADGRTRRVFLPLVSRPVRVVRSTLLAPAGLEPVADIELTAWIQDRDRRIELDHRIEIGGGALDAVTDVAIPPALLARLHRLRTFAVDAAAAPASKSTTSSRPATTPRCSGVRSGRSSWPAWPSSPLRRRAA